MPAPTLPACSEDATGACTVAVGVDVRAIEVDATRVFWVEHRGFDALGNPREDGALRAQLHAGGPVETIADGLAGPVALGVTTSHAYVQLAQRPRVDGPRGSATVPVRLIDGHVAPVTEGPRLLPRIVLHGDRGSCGVG